MSWLRRWCYISCAWVQFLDILLYKAAVHTDKGYAALGSLCIPPGCVSCIHTAQRWRRWLEISAFGEHGASSCRLFTACKTVARFPSQCEANLLNDRIKETEKKCKWSAFPSSGWSG